MKPLSTSPTKGRRQRAVRVYNTSDETLKAWACVQYVAGSPLKMREGEPTWDVEIVTTAGVQMQDPWRFLFLLDRPIPPGKTGRATQDWPVLTRATDEVAERVASGVEMFGETIGVLVDGASIAVSDLNTVSPKAGSQVLDGLGNVFSQLGPLVTPGEPVDYGPNTLRYVTPVRQNFPPATTIGGMRADDISAAAGSAMDAKLANGFTRSDRPNRDWFRVERDPFTQTIVTEAINATNPVYIDFPGWYTVQFTARVSASADVAGIVSLGIRFIEGDDDTITDEYTEADHQPIIMPSATDSGGSPSHTHGIDYDGDAGAYDPDGEPLTINPNIWLGITILHRFTEAGSFHFRNFGLIDVTIQEFHWTASYRGPNYGA